MNKLALGVNGYPLVGDTDSELLTKIAIATPTEYRVLLPMATRNASTSTTIQTIDTNCALVLLLNLTAVPVPGSTLTLQLDVYSDLANAVSSFVTFTAYPSASGIGLIDYWAGPPNLPVSVGFDRRGNVFIPRRMRVDVAHSVGGADWDYSLEMLLCKS